MDVVDQLAVVRDKALFFGWPDTGEVERGDASDIYVAERAVERAFHMTGVAAYLEYHGVRSMARD